MANSNLSIMGIYNYNSAVFNGFSVPDGIDRTLAIDTILMNCAELELIYPRFDVLQYAIASWSNKQQSIWAKLFSTTNLVYNPIWNKDGKITETWTDTYNKRMGHSENGENESGTESSGANETTVSAYNSITYEPREKLTSSAETSANGSYSSEGSDTETGTVGREYERVEQGNIGVTSTQQLIKEEREIDKFNIYDFIADEFKNRFCLLVY